MNTRKTFYTEAAYIAGILTLAFGTALMERANYGISMVVAPAYLLYLKISRSFSFFTFGMAEYCLQAFLLIVLTIVMRKFKRKYLFSFVTAVIYGMTLDTMMAIAGKLPMQGVAGHMIFFLLGMIICSIGVAFLFHTYITPEAYELFVKEVSEKYHIKISKTKTVYDCCSCGIAILISFVFFGFGHFEGVKAGTIVCALINGWLIGRCSWIYEKLFVFKDGLGIKKYFD